MKTKVYVIQDGADFYLHTADDCDTHYKSVKAPYVVKDDDMDEAKKARQWFMDWCEDTNHEPKWMVT